LGITSSINDSLPRGARGVGKPSPSGAGNTLQPPKANLTRIHRHPLHALGERLSVATGK
jgi:hypothetical protein